jgi:hypothetical protein
MTTVKYILVGSNGKYLQADGSFDRLFNTTVLFSSLEEITTYIEQNLPVDQYTIITSVIKE